MNVAPEPTNAVRCTDIGVLAHPIDHVALSQGLQDGVYFAGLQTGPWFAFEDIREASDMVSRMRLRSPGGEAAAARYEELRAKRRGQSVVIRWEVTSGQPGPASEIRYTYTDGITEQGDERFTWNTGAGAEALAQHLIAEARGGRIPDGMTAERAKKDIAALVAKQAERGAWLVSEAAVLQAVARAEAEILTERLKRLLSGAAGTKYKAGYGAALEAIDLEENPIEPVVGTMADVHEALEARLRTPEAIRDHAARLRGSALFYLELADSLDAAAFNAEVRAVHQEPEDVSHG